MRDYLHRLRLTSGLREPGLVSTAVLTLTGVAFFRVALLPEFGAELAMTTFQLGMVTTVFALGRLAADLPGGHFADRVRARALMGVSGSGVALGSLLIGVSPGATLVYVAAFILGISSSTTNATGMTFFSNATGSSHRGTSMAVFSAALLGGQAAGPAAAGLISSAAGWRVTMVIGAGIALAVVVTLALIPTRERVSRAPEETVEEEAAVGSRVPAPGAALVLQSVSFAVFLTLGAVPQTLVPIIGADELGLGTAAIGLALGLGGVARFVGTLIGGRLSDRMSRKGALVPGLAVQGLGVALLALQPSVAIWLISIVVMSLASFAVPVAATIVGDLTEASRVGSQLGRFRFVGDVGLILGPLVVTALFESVGRVAAFLFVAGILAIAALLSWRYLPETGTGRLG
ncbi:MAG TPA: MFS transporter [Acidimicrobiia bacterium]|jgi:MFS family permease|nr:MFS transporter [Acidimicrobiia bacterium]